ncbi:Tn3 family transposase [Streptomyces mirabilis]|uniref:Tn3 family transposase n=1 Tax=Streptomyces mirabilis TaxID=68239 RepID=UPI00367ED2FA
MLNLVDPIDDTCHRRMNRQLTGQESRQTMARAICYGKRGRIQQPFRRGKKDQLATLGLVLNAVVLWNTRYLDAAVTALREAGTKVRDEDLMSPLKARHLNVLGQYSFCPAVPDGGMLRPLRDPADAGTEAEDSV